METQKYMRRPFSVDAVRVTAENFDEVAVWCNGEKKLTRPKSTPSGDTGQRPYIHINVNRPLTPKQAMAFVGDWILYAGTGFKVFTDKAFHKTFVAAYAEVVTTTPVTRFYLNDHEVAIQREDGLQFSPRLSDDMPRGGILPEGATVHHNEEGVRSIAYDRAPMMVPGREGVPYGDLSINAQRRMAGLPSYPGPAEDMTITPQPSLREALGAESDMPIYQDVVGNTLSADNTVHLANLEDGQ